MGIQKTGIVSLKQKLRKQKLRKQHSYQNPVISQDWPKVQIYQQYESVGAVRTAGLALTSLHEL